MSRIEDPQIESHGGYRQWDFFCFKLHSSMKECYDFWLFKENSEPLC